ncbi:MAG: CapA family protein [Lachnospiraceae bacterium]|nr:CapA family protein [Lachnospiraceae bacterium]
MRRKTVYLIIFIAFSLYLEACGGFLNGGEESPQEGLVQADAVEGALAADSTRQESTVQESPEQENLRQEQRRAEFVVSLTENLPIEKSEEEKMDFVEWLLDSYGIELLETINVSENINRQLYDVTGKSLYVLWDTSLGYLEDENTAAAHGIYIRETEGSMVDLAFAGDICLTEDGYVIDHYDALGGDITLCLSEEIMDRLNKADISMINHEYPVSTRGTALEGKYYTFRADPEREIILQQMGIDIVSLANNHIYDFGADAFYDTLEALKQADLPYVGAGADMEEASRPVYFVAGGIKIGFVSANRSEKYIFTPEAGENSPGVVRMYDTEMMNNIIKEASGQCDYLIAYVHWGTEDSKYYETYQTEIAEEFFTSGADAIIGSHPHVLQGIEYVDGKPVVYSLGDFWFNRETKYTTIVTLKITIDGFAELSVLPCIQKGYETHYISDESGQTKFYDYLRTLSPKAVIDDHGIVTEKY